MMADAAAIVATRTNPIVVLSPPLSQCSPSPTDSGADAVPCGGITGQPRPSVHLKRSPPRDLWTVRHTTVTKGRGDFGLPLVSSHVLPLRRLEREGKQRAGVPGQGSNSADVVVLQASGHRDCRFNAESSADALAPKIEEMDRLTLRALGPATAENGSRPPRMAMRHLSSAASPGIAACRLLLLLNEYFMRARRFSARNVMEVDNPGLLRSIVYLLGLKSETREALTLTLDLRVPQELGWMAHQEIADVTLDLMGLQPCPHYRRRLNQVESALSTESTTLFLEHSRADTPVEVARLVLARTVERQGIVRRHVRHRLGGRVKTWQRILQSAVP